MENFDLRLGLVRRLSSPLPASSTIQMTSIVLQLREQAHDLGVLLTSVRLSECSCSIRTWHDAPTVWVFSEHREVELVTLALQIVLRWLIVESWLVLRLIDTAICEAIELGGLNDLHRVVVLLCTSFNAWDCAELRWLSRLHQHPLRVLHQPRVPIVRLQGFGLVCLFRCQR